MRTISDSSNSHVDRAGLILGLILGVMAALFVVCVLDVNAQDSKTKKYQWLFKDPVPEDASTEDSPLLNRLDRELKNARKIYLSGDLENSLTGYKATMEMFEAAIQDMPPGHPLLSRLDERFAIFDELITKIMGPLNLEQREDVSATVFSLTEKKRLCRRNLILKKAGLIHFSDVPAPLVKEEAGILTKLEETSQGGSSAEARRNESGLRSKLSELRKEIYRHSVKYSLMTKGVQLQLSDVKSMLGKDDLVLDFNLLSDRIIIGVISNESAVYQQVPVNRSEMEKAVFNVQDLLREFNSGEKSSFMGHEWKEACRRVYRLLFGKLPQPPTNKRVYIIPDRALWYLPFSAILDPEDRPFGKDRLITLVPSADILRYLKQGKSGSGQEKTLVCFESIPWVEQSKESGEGERRKLAGTETQREVTENIILTSSVYPKPTDLAAAMQKLFKKCDFWTGPAATFDKLPDYKAARDAVFLMAVPFGMTDLVSPEIQPTLYFSANKRGNRKFDVSRLFSTVLSGDLMILPIAWTELQDKESLSGEGPLLFSIATLYSGIRTTIVNYSDPNWGSEEPFLMEALKKLGQGQVLSDVFEGYAREFPTSVDSSFSGKPPSWIGWIIQGDPSK